MAYRLVNSFPQLDLANMGGCSGLGGCGCGGTCKGGLGLFDSGMDFTTWGWQEWGIVIVGGYVALSTVFNTQRAVGRVRAFPSDVRASVKRGRKRLGKRIAGD